jgi:hypothetical protein
MDFLKKNFEVRCVDGKAVAGKLGRFQGKYFRECVPESFRWTVYMTRLGTNISISEHVSC